MEGGWQLGRAPAPHGFAWETPGNAHVRSQSSTRSLWPSHDTRNFGSRCTYLFRSSDTCRHRNHALKAGTPQLKSSTPGTPSASSSTRCTPA